MANNHDNPTVRHNNWEQYFPTYKFDDRDVALKEYDVAANTLGLEEKLYSMASSIAVIAGTIIASIAVGKISATPPSKEYIFFIFIMSIFISYFTVKYFASLHKSVVFSSRKIIVLRRMLGLRYGAVRLVLPNWRIEGADEPFVIPMFPGWANHAVYPFYIVGLLASVLIYFSWPPSFPELSEFILLYFSDVYFIGWDPLLIPSALWFMFLVIVFRHSLFDYHEGSLLIVSKLLSVVFRVKLQKNFEYIIYRAILSIYEIKRLDINLSNVRNVSIYREDRSFFKHWGISYRGIARSISLILRKGKKTGGSTITQQLVRTLFISYPISPWRRKIVEICLALWIERHVEKKQILDMYIASVRYDDGVYGLPAAMKCFFGKIVENPTKSQSFVLIERVSNITKSFNGKAVESSLRSALEMDVITKHEALGALDIYEQLVQKNTIRSVIGPSPKEIYNNLMNGDQ